MRGQQAIVIGAGFGGLAAALVLATRGAKVTVLEAADTPGGKAGRVTVDGVGFDTGPSLFTLPQVLESLLALAGTRLDEHLSLIRSSPAFRYRYPDGTCLDIEDSLEGTRQSVARSLGTTAAREFDDFLAYSEKIWRAAAPHFVYGDAPTIRSLMTRMSALFRLPAIDAMQSMQKAIYGRIKSPHLRALFMRFATYNGSDVRRAPATLNCIAHIELAMGGYGVEGGMHAVVEALVTTCEKLGVTFQMNAPVDGVQTQSGQVTGVRTQDGTEYRADLVVSNVDPAHLMEKLLPERYQSKSKGEASMSAYNAVFKASTEAPTQRVSHEVIFPREYLDEFEDIFDSKSVPREPTLYLCDQTLSHRVGTWGDATPLFIMVNAPPTQSGHGPIPQWSDLEPSVRSRLATAGLIDSDDPVVWHRDPIALANRFPGSQGGIYGAASNSLFSAFGRPTNRMKKPTGLYVASGGAHPGGGVPLCLLSGLAAARAAIADNRGPTEGLWVKGS